MKGTRCDVRCYSAWWSQSPATTAIFVIIYLVLLMPLHGWAGVDVLTQHNDQWRTGSNTQETLLTPTNVNTGSFGKLYAYSVDGYVYAQPLYVSGITVAGATHNVLFVATMEDSVYAFDADQNTTFWHKQFTGGNITPVPIADITGSNDRNIHGNVGILSTPVIDKATSTIYVLARTKDTSNNTYLQSLHALDLATGNEKMGGPVNISPSGFNTKMQNQRPALGLNNGTIYVCWGSHEDETPYNGYVISFNASTLALEHVFNTTPGGSEGAVWQAGQAPAFDNAGNVYVTTGNGDWDGTTRWGETCLKLSPTLSVLDWCTPADYATLNKNDTDFGAAGCMLLPGATGYPSTSYVLTGGKEGRIFVADINHGMGHVSTGDTNVHQVWQATQTVRCSRHIHGTPIYWNSHSQGKLIYVWGENDVGKAFKFDGTNFNTTPFSTTAVSSPTAGCGMPGSILALSSDGDTNGIVWANCVYTGDAVHDIVPGILRAYDANDLSHELWNSYQTQSRDDLGNLAKYVPPTIANGKVYMASFSKTVCVYGELNASSPVANGTYKIISRNSGLALGVDGAGTSKSTTARTGTEQETYAGLPSQKWTLTQLSGGLYEITGVESGMVLDVLAQSKAPGAIIDIYPYRGQSNQQWLIEPTTTPGYFTIKGAQSGLLIDVNGRSTQPGALVQQWGANGGNNQQWSFMKP